MSESRATVPVQVPNIEVTENLTSSSHLSASVERLVEVTRRLTVCNQLQSALNSQTDTTECPDDKYKTAPTSDVPLELAEEERIKPTTGTAHSSETSSTCNLATPDSKTGQSPQCTTKKWARLLGISSEDIGDEEEFIRAATAITAHVPARQSNTMSVAEQRALRQSWNAALDAAHFGSLESMESTSGNSLRRSSSWKDKMSLPFFSKRCTQVKTVQQDELLKMIASGKPSYEQVHRWRKSFEALLADKYGLALFKEFLATEFSDENIEFWIACEEYKTITQPKKQQAKAQKIYEDFIATQACREINLDSVTREQTIAELASPSTHTFENAQKRIQALMERDSYGRFLRSDLFLTLLNQAKQAARELAAAARDGHEGGGGNLSGESSARFRLLNFMGGGGGVSGPLRAGGVGTDLPGVLAAAADAEAGMNSVQDLELLGLSTSRHMRNMTKNAANKRSTSSGKSSTSPAKAPV
uniref:Regulator of G protein signaling 3 n=1 Tax=Echinococcus granulosus TaxID=6210 RepID=A0A068WGQ6_ECHGR|nr:regulator of G protein signaling 3 [Echinococcus granulosus]